MNTLRSIVEDIREDIRWARETRGPRHFLALGTLNRRYRETTNRPRRIVIRFLRAYCMYNIAKKFENDNCTAIAWRTLWRPPRNWRPAIKATFAAISEHVQPPSDGSLMDDVHAFLALEDDFKGGLQGGH